MSCNCMHNSGIHGKVQFMTMEKRMHDMARMLVANGYGFGKYWSGYIFGKTAKDAHFIYLSDNRMAILSAGIDEDGEKSILEAADTLSREQLDSFFRIGDYDKATPIEWLEKEVNFILLCDKPELVRNNTAYFMWPAVKLSFTDELRENSVVVYDRFTPAVKIEALRTEAQEKGISHKVEFWPMVKHLALTDRFGEFAPKVCMEAVVQFAKKG